MFSKQKNKIMEDIFDKILSQTASTEEKQAFYESVSNNEEKRQAFLDYKNLYTLNSYTKELYRQKSKDSFGEFWEKVQNKKTRFTIQSLLRYAAVIVLAMLGGFSIHYFTAKNPGDNLKHLAYNTKKGSISEIKLDDGSTIWLSSCTDLVVDQTHRGETQIRLNGEAYFDLVPSKTRKLTVDLGYFKIHDIGTKFNIRAYNTDKEILTNLIEGKINFTQESGEYITSIKPGEIARFSTTDQKMKISNIDPLISIAWTEGKFVFIDKTLQEICTELENWYDVDIIIEDQQLAKTKYTSVVKRSTTIQLVLKMLNITDNIHYEITDQPIGKDIIRIKK